MALQVYKINLTGYVIRNTDLMDDPNHIDLSTVMEMVIENQHECTSLQGKSHRICDTQYGYYG